MFFSNPALNVGRGILRHDFGELMTGQVCSNPVLNLGRGILRHRKTGQPKIGGKSSRATLNFLGHRSIFGPFLDTLFFEIQH